MVQRVIKEIETRTVRELGIDDIEQALRDQYDLHVQDDITFKWRSTGASPTPAGVDIIHTERSIEAD